MCLKKLRAIFCLVLIVLSIAVVGGTLTYCSRGYNNTIAEHVSFKGDETDGITVCATQGSQYAGARGFNYVASQGHQYNPRGFSYVVQGRQGQCDLTI